MDTKIPEQHEGGFSNTVSENKFETTQAAEQHFETVKKRFLDINHWKDTASFSANFSLFDASGAAVNRDPQIGDYMKIDIPGPENKTSEGDDWVKIEALDVEKSPGYESISMRARPAPSPLVSDGDTAHFYSNDATSNFAVKRRENLITAEVYGRNEKPNTEDLGVIEKIRNTVVALGGILFGSKFQWKSLTDGLVKDEE